MIFRLYGKRYYGKLVEKSDSLPLELWQEGAGDNRTVGPKWGRSEKSGSREGDGVHPRPQQYEANEIPFQRTACNPPSDYS
jgi:hypothetical protein